MQGYSCDMTRRVGQAACIGFLLVAISGCFKFGPIFTASCGNKLVASSTGPVQDPALVEISGIQSGRANNGIWWVHNDSGDSARLFAIGDNGVTQRVYTLTGALAVDWEDLAIGRGPVPGTSYLYAGDIGDNAAARSEIVVYRVPEPTVTTGAPTALGGVEALRLRYPDGAHNAEALFMDPLTGDLVIVEKKLAGGNIGVYHAPANLVANSLTTMELAKTINVGTGIANVVTGASISPDGSQIGLRTYGGTRIFQRESYISAPAALSGRPCIGPTPAEIQGEAIGFDSDSRGFVTVSEGSNQLLNHYRAP